MTDEEETSATVGWIYKLNKEELIGKLSERKLPTEGNVAQLRTRLVQDIRTKTQEPGDTITETKVDNENLSKQMDIIRKWGLHFDGSKNPIDFLERLEELQTVYEIPNKIMLQALPETLKGKAILWYRNNNKYWDDWKDFKKDFTDFFLGSNNLQSLENQIRNRIQRVGEKIRDYVIDIQTLIRRHSNFEYQEEINRVYTNMRPHYKLFIRRQDISSVQDLIRLAEEYDDLQAEIRREGHTEIHRSRPQYNTQNSPNWSHPTTTHTDTDKISNFDRQTCCWRCGRRGHNRRNCRATPVLFCSHCGRLGIRSNECTCRTRTENSERTGSRGGNPVNA